MRSQYAAQGRAAIGFWAMQPSQIQGNSQITARISEARNKTDNEIYFVAGLFFCRVNSYSVNAPIPEATIANRNLSSGGDLYPTIRATVVASVTGLLCFHS